jgi:MYXO-CTERM domain-containing protein
VQNGSISAILGGSGALTKSGAGTVTLSGVNTFTGALSVQNGSLSVSSINDASANGTLGNSASAVALGGLDTTGELLYTGATASSTRPFSMTSGGTGAINVSNSSAALTLSGALTGAGNLTKAGAGTMVLSGVNTYSGGTLVSAGTLQGNTTSLQGLITNNATVAFDQSTNGTYSSTISGTGSLTKSGTGTVTVSGASYSGGTLISQGALALKDLTTDLQGNIVNSGTVIFDQGLSTNRSYAGTISGTGSVNKAGAGDVSLTADNSYTGRTWIQFGTLDLNAAALGARAAGSTTNVTVDTGATLLISKNQQVNDTATISLSGGTIRTAAGVSEVFGNLSVTANSLLDFGTTSYANANTINFGSYSYTPSALLSIDNFNFGSTMTFKSNLSNADLATFSFTNGGIASSSWNDGTSTFTITAIPETSTYVAALGLLALGAAPLLRRKRVKVS